MEVERQRDHNTSCTTQYPEPSPSPCETIPQLLPSSSTPDLLVEESSKIELPKPVLVEELAVSLPVQVPKPVVQRLPIQKHLNNSSTFRSTRRVRVKCIGKKRKRLPEMVGEATLNKHRKAKRSLSTVNELYTSPLSISLSNSWSTQSFVKSIMPNFWECPKCQKIPISLRVKHSVFFCGGPLPPTSIEYPIIRNHFQACEKRLLELNGKSFPKSDCTYYYSDTTLSDAHDEEERSKPNNSRKSRRISEQTKNVDRYTIGGVNKRGKRSRATGTDEKHISQPKPKKRKKNNSSKNLPATGVSQPHPPKQVSNICVPPTENGLVYPSKDKNLTATVDILIMSQVALCSYVRAEDTTAYLRQKPLPENFPGLACVHCRVKLDEGKQDSQIPQQQQRKQKQKQQPPTSKNWFFNSAIQLATGLPKIEQHLMKSCRMCPKSIRTDIMTAKIQEEEERVRLRLRSDEKITRRQYASLVFDRMGTKGFMD